MTERRTARWARIVQSIPFRLFVAAAILGVHLCATAMFAKYRYDLPFNSAPGEAPHYDNPAEQHRPTHWDRLVVARWDAAHYMSIALRGYSQCPAGSLADEDLRPLFIRCDIGFYPGYALLGKVVMWATHLPIDYALFGVSLFSSFVFLFLWTGPALVKTLGLGVTWLSLLVFNAFSTGYSLIAILTEPPALVLTIGAFVALHRRWWLFGALLAGAATGLRVNAAATGLAFALAVLASLFTDRPQGPLRWTTRLLAMPLAGWGIMTMMGYDAWRFHDPLIYVHAHSQAYSHQPNPFSLLWPKVEWVLRAIDHPLHEAVVFLVVVILFLFGHRRALRGIVLYEQVFWYGLTVLGLGISLVGSVEIAFAGMNRYTLLELPVFFAIAAALKRRPVILAVYLVASVWHYWQVDLCDYLGGVGPLRMTRCHVTQWLNSW
jgi:hypothetical protein